MDLIAWDVWEAVLSYRTPCTVIEWGRSSSKGRMLNAGLVELPAVGHKLCCTQGPCWEGPGCFMAQRSACVSHVGRRGSDAAGSPAVPSCCRASLKVG